MAVEQLMRTLYERPSKDEKEANFFDSFVALAVDIPAGRWEESEAPDYLLCTSDLRIGLEITSIVASDVAGIRSAQDEAFALSQQLAVEGNLPIMEVRAKFRDDRALVDSTAAAIELVGIVKDNLAQIDDTRSKLLNGFQGKYFSSIIVSLGTRNGRRWLGAHRWHRAHMGFVAQDPIERMQAAFLEKESKLPQYLKVCDECWLLVGVNEWTTPEAIHFSTEGLKHSFESSFARAYFLRNIEGSLARLILKSPRGI